MSVEAAGAEEDLQVPRRHLENERERETAFYQSEKIITQEYDSICTITWEFWEPGMTQMYCSVVKGYTQSVNKVFTDDYEEAAHQSFFLISVDHYISHFLVLSIYVIGKEIPSTDC